MALCMPVLWAGPNISWPALPLVLYSNRWLLAGQLSTGLLAQTSIFLLVYSRHASVCLPLFKYSEAGGGSLFILRSSLISCLICIRLFLCQFHAFVAPSIIRPRFCLVFQTPFTSSSFYGDGVLLTVSRITTEDGSTLCTPWSTALLQCLRSFSSEVCASWIQSSTKTSSMCRTVCPFFIEFFFGRSSPVSSGGCCSSAPTGSWTRYSATFLDVFETAQKNVGNCAHPICSAAGTNISTNWPGWFGSQYAKFHPSHSLFVTLQNPSLRSTFMSFT